MAMPGPLEMLIILLILLIFFGLAIAVLVVVLLIARKSGASRPGSPPCPHSGSHLAPLPRQHVAAMNEHADATRERLALLKRERLAASGVDAAGAKTAVVAGKPPVGQVVVGVAEDGQALRVPFDGVRVINPGGLLAVRSGLIDGRLLQWPITASLCGRDESAGGRRGVGRHEDLDHLGAAVGRDHALAPLLDAVEEVGRVALASAARADPGLLGRRA